jgi:hypothetical protein
LGVIEVQVLLARIGNVETVSTQVQRTHEGVQQVAVAAWPVADGSGGPVRPELVTVPGKVFDDRVQVRIVGRRAGSLPQPTNNAYRSVLPVQMQAALGRVEKELIDQVVAGRETG